MNSSVWLLLCSLLLVTAYPAEIPRVPSPCCAPTTMTVEEHLLEVTNGHNFEKHITHYVDLHSAKRYAQRVRSLNPPGTTIEWVHFNNNHTRYFHIPSQQICIETSEMSSITTCVPRGATFSNTAWVGNKDTPTRVYIFTRQHDNITDTFSVTDILCIPVGSLVYRKADGKNQVIDSSYFNITSTFPRPDPSIFSLPSYCFNNPGQEFEDVGYLSEAAKNFRFIL